MQLEDLWTLLFNDMMQDESLFKLEVHCRFLNMPVWTGLFVSPVVIVVGVFFLKP